MFRQGRLQINLVKSTSSSRVTYGKGDLHNQDDEWWDTEYRTLEW